ncbi:hypothetical protein BDV93DRAFT_581642, partial [Ceratobasidium sp. AG-I]
LLHAPLLIGGFPSCLAFLFIVASQPFRFGRLRDLLLIGLLSIVLGSYCSFWLFIYAMITAMTYGELTCGLHLDTSLPNLGLLNISSGTNDTSIPYPYCLESPTIIPAPSMHNLDYFPHRALLLGRKCSGCLRAPIDCARSRSLNDIHSSGALSPSPLRNCVLYNEAGLPIHVGQPLISGVGVSPESMHMPGVNQMHHQAPQCSYPLSVTRYIPTPTTARQNSLHTPPTATTCSAYMSTPWSSHNGPPISMTPATAVMATPATSIMISTASAISPISSTNTRFQSPYDPWAECLWGGDRRWKPELSYPRSEERRVMEEVGWEVEGSCGQGGNGVLGMETEDEDDTRTKWDHRRWDFSMVFIERKPTVVAGFSHHAHSWVVDAELLVPVHPPDSCDICRVWAEHPRFCSQQWWEVYERSRDEATGVQESIAREKVATETRLDESRRHNEELLARLGDRATDIHCLEVKNAGLAQELETARAELETLRDKPRETTIGKGRKAKGKADMESRGIQKRERCIGDTSAQRALAQRCKDATIDALVTAHSSPRRSPRRQAPLAGSKVSSPATQPFFPVKHSTLIGKTPPFSGGLASAPSAENAPRYGPYKRALASTQRVPRVADQSFCMIFAASEAH